LNFANHYRRVCAAAFSDVVLVAWDRDGRQNTDDGDDDHHFNEGKAVLLVGHGDSPDILIIVFSRDGTGIYLQQARPLCRDWAERSCWWDKR
jgi:hypothetical protein